MKEYKEHIREAQVKIYKNKFSAKPLLYVESMYFTMHIGFCIVTYQNDYFVLSLFTYLYSK